MFDMAHAGAFPLVCAACGFEPGGVDFVLLGAVARSFCTASLRE
ncbi:hypothetical protein D8I24_7954 [Cupriavidus necator H850]|nr:hypothetical protein D8I24_7954 [Cupriavidus necator H850]